jgi:hypothetical protein
MAILWPSRTRISALLAVFLLAAARVTAAPLPIPAAQPFEAGFALDSAHPYDGAPSLRCTNAAALDKRGVEWDYDLDQKRATPLVMTGWSRAEAVSGVDDADYAIYADLLFDDGSHGYGYAAAFATGTHDWQRRRLTITPGRPIRRLQLYALFRGHAGASWFAPFAVVSLAGAGVWDSQPMAPPRLSARRTSGWFVRDVAADGPALPITPGGPPVAGLTLASVRTAEKGQSIATALRAGGIATRAVTLYYAERLPQGADPVFWWNTLRERREVTNAEATNAVTAGDAGATGTQTKYPFACVTTAHTGRALALPPDLGPRIARLGYHPGARLLYAAFDLALLPDRAPATVALARWDVSPEWGLRDAARHYYATYPKYYARRTKVQGVWMPFTDPSTLPHPEDFHIGWHEGDNSVASDDRLGILSFRYTEPMSFWMPMPTGEPRDYETARARLNRLASGAEPASDQTRHQAQATLSSGSRAADGRLNVRFENAPWCNGAVWTLNPNPRLPGEWTKARVNDDPADAARRYGPVGYAGGVLDGEYLDSVEGWADVLDYAPASLRASPAPPTFARESFRPVVPTWFSVDAYTRSLRADLRRRGKLLMGNGTPWSLYTYGPLLDAAGTETDWLDEKGEYRPESDATLLLRRTLSGPKPYLLLLNTDFERFTHADVEKYFARCLFYGIFPSFFSANAADKPYWSNPRWYERDRDLFRKYLPVLCQIAAAGWDPITDARSSAQSVYLERYGKGYLTAFNASSQPQNATIIIDRAVFGASKPAAKLVVTELLTGAAVPVTAGGARAAASLTISLAPEQTAVLRIAL